MLYLTVFNLGAKDWINQDVRIGFDKEDSQLNEGFKPEWHHVFPRKVLREIHPDEIVDSIANIVVLNERANRSFSSKLPQVYLQEHKVDPERLNEQGLPAADNLDLARFEEFLNTRADTLAKRATAFLAELAR